MYVYDTFGDANRNQDVHMADLHYVSTHSSCFDFPTGDQGGVDTAGDRMGEECLSEYSYGSNSTTS